MIIDKVGSPTVEGEEALADAVRVHVAFGARAVDLPHKVQQVLVLALAVDGGGERGGVVSEPRRRRQHLARLVARREHNVAPGAVRAAAQHCLIARDVGCRLANAAKVLSIFFV